jgi:hypothetical protein
LTEHRAPIRQLQWGSAQWRVDMQYRIKGDGERDDDEPQRRDIGYVKRNLGHSSHGGYFIRPDHTYAAGDGSTVELRHADDGELPSGRPEIVPV